MTTKKMTRKEWCKEFAPDMGYRFEDTGTRWKTRRYLLHRKKDGRAFGYDTLLEVQNHILKDLQRHIGKHTVIVPARRKK